MNTAAGRYRRNIWPCSQKGGQAAAGSSTWYMLSRWPPADWQWDGLSLAILMIRNPWMQPILCMDKHFGCTSIWRILRRRLQRRDREGETDSAGMRRRMHAIQEVFSYAAQIQRFYEALGKDRVKVIVCDDFVFNTGQVYRDTLQFLGLDVEFEADFKVVNPVKPVAPGVNSFFAKRPKLRNVVHKLVPAGVQRKIADAMPYVTKTIQRAPKITPEVRERLIPRFRSDVERVSEMLGRI